MSSMTTDPSDAIAAAADELVRQHAQREPFRALPAALAPHDAQAAYRVQDAYVERLARVRGSRVAGYKVALTTRAMREMVGFHDSVAGCVMADQMIASGGSVEANAYGRLIVEFEIAFRIARDLPTDRAEPWNRHSILDHVVSAHPALEIADDRQADYATLASAVLVLIADNAWNQGLVLGDAAAGLTPDQLLHTQGIARSDGVEIGRGTGADVLGHPLDALAWAANHLQSRGIALRRDAVVTTGSLVRSHFPQAGSTLDFELSGIGGVRLQVR